MTSMRRAAAHWSAAWAAIAWRAHETTGDRGGSEHLMRSMPQNFGWSSAFERGAGAEKAYCGRVFVDERKSFVRRRSCSASLNIQRKLQEGYRPPA